VTFFLDQDVPDDVAMWLRHCHHTVICLREVLPITTIDAEVRSWAESHGADSLILHQILYSPSLANLREDEVLYSGIDEESSLTAQPLNKYEAVSIQLEFGVRAARP